MKRRVSFIVLWTLAVAASASAFIVHLALRGRIVTAGYELGRAKEERRQLSETRKAMQTQIAAYKTPERVEGVARSLLGMDPPTSDRIIVLSPPNEVHGRVARITESTSP